MASKIRLIGTCVAVMVIMAACVGLAFAQDQPVGQKEGPVEGLYDSIVKPLFKTVVFGIVGIVILLIGYKVIDMATPFAINKEIAEDDNTAAGVLAAGMLVAIAVILHAAISIA